MRQNRGATLNTPVVIENIQIEGPRRIAFRGLSAKAPLAVRLAKEAVQAAFETSLSEGLEIERKNFFLLFATEDMREGMRAFIEKRKAEFKGR